MRKLLITGQRQVEIIEEPNEPLGKNAIRIKSIYNGISHGTEMNFYRGTAPAIENNIVNGLFLKKSKSESLYPIWHGYETVGEVVEVGKDVADFKVGDIAWTGSGHADIVTCETTVNGRPFFCERMPDGADMKSGIFMALAGVAFDGYLTSGIMSGESCVVFGLGCIGLICVQILHNAGVHNIIAVDPIEKRRILASEFGATQVVDPVNDDVIKYVFDESTRGKGVDVAFETSGSWKALHQSIRCCASGYGRVVALGFYQGSGTDLRLGEEFHHSTFYEIGASSILAINKRREPAVGRAWDKIRVYRTMAKMLAEGQIKTEKLLSKTYPFEQASQAYELIDKSPQDVIKVALKY